MGITSSRLSRSSSWGTLLSQNESRRSSANSKYSLLRIWSTSLGGIGGRLGPTSKPGNPVQDGIRGGSGTRGVGGPVENEGDDRDDTGLATAGEVSVLFAANDAMVDTTGDEGVPVARQTVETNEGK